MPESRLPSLQSPSTAPPAVQSQSRLPSLGGSDIPFNLPEPAPDPQIEQNYGWGITTAFQRGFERLRSLPDVAQGDYEELAQHFESMQQYDLSPHDQQRMQELQNTEGWWEATAYYFKNPALIAQVVAESLPMSVAPLVGGVVGGVGGTAAGGPPGGVVGTMGGAAAGSYATEYLNSVSEFMGEEGIDMTDPEALKRAFADPQLMEGARQYGKDRGVPIAVFDALSFGLAGRIYKPTSALVKGATGRGLGMTAEIGMQAGAGMAGEAGAQISAEGEITDIPGVIAEGFGEIVPGFVEQGANAWMRTRQGETADDALSKQLRQDVPDTELDKMADIEVVKPDALAVQASLMAPTREQIQVQQYQQMAAERAEADAQQAAVEADLETTARSTERRSQAWMDLESEREAGVERQRQEAEYQQELQKGEEAAQIAPYETPETTPAAEPDKVVTAGPTPGTSLGEALTAAGVAKPAETEVEVETAPETTPEPAPEPEPAPVDTRLQELESEQEAAQAAFDAKPNLSSKRRLFRANRELKQYQAETADVDTETTTTGGAADERSGSVTTTRDTGVAGAAAVAPAEAAGAAEAVPTPGAVAAETAVDAQELKAVANEAATSPLNDLPQPTEGQKEAGNYRKGHTSIKGIDITIENPMGSTRRGRKLKDHYGYIKRTMGRDNDQVDVFIAPKPTQTNRVWVIDQVNERGEFDEHKVMLGYNNQLDAVRGYKRNYEKGWKVGPVTEMTLDQFKKWLRDGNTRRAVSDTKPSRQARKFVRTQKGYRYSKSRAKKVLVEDAQQAVPGSNVEWVQQVLGAPVENKPDPAVQRVVDQILTLEEQRKETSDVTPQPLTATQARVAVAPLNEQLGLGVEIHDNVEALTDVKLKRAIVEELGPRPPAIYDIQNDRIHVFADRFTNVEDVIKAALHEGVAHKGLRVLYSKTAPSGTVVTDQQAFNDLMMDVYGNATNDKLLRKAKLKYAEDPNNLTKREQLVVGEEYLAEMAEQGVQPRLLQRIVAAIRKQLRKMGFAKDWTDNDVHTLLAEARGALRDARPIGEIRLTEEVQVEETGEVFEVETNAEVVLRQHDKRVGVVERLRACL